MGYDFIFPSSIFLSAFPVRLRRPPRCDSALKPLAPGLDLWDIPIVKATTVDDRRRIVMPSECPPHSAVIIQQLDDNAWLVKRAVADRRFKMIAIPIIKRLPDHPAWEKTEAALAQYAAGQLPEPD